MRLVFERAPLCNLCVRQGKKKHGKVVSIIMCDPMIELESIEQVQGDGMGLTNSQISCSEAARPLHLVPCRGCRRSDRAVFLGCFRPRCSKPEAIGD